MGLAMTAVAAGCGGDGGGGTDEDVGGAAPTTAAVSTAPPTTATGTGPRTDLTLRIADVRLENSEESDNGVRILLPNGVATASVTLTGLPSPNRVISVCQARELERRLSTAVCRQPASGESTTVTLGADASGIEIVQAGLSSSGPEGNTTTLGEVTIRYAASSREVDVRMSQIASGESGARPSFSLTPAGTSGAYRATLTWTVIQVFGGTPSNAQVEVVQGGNVVNSAQGGGLQVQLNGNVPPPVADAAVRVQNIGTSALVNPKLDLLLP